MSGRLGGLAGDLTGGRIGERAGRRAPCMDGGELFRTYGRGGHEEIVAEGAENDARLDLGRALRY